MKRLLVLFCLLVLRISALSALGVAIAVLGVGVGYAASQDTAAGDSFNATSGGIFVCNHIYWTNTSFVIYVAGIYGLVLGSKYNGDAIDLGQYLTFSFDEFAGLGYRLPLGKPWTAVIAAGGYVGGTFIGFAGPFNLPLLWPKYLRMGIGPGIGASLSYSLASNWGIGASVNLGYSLFTGSETGISVFGGVGISIGT